MATQIELDETREVDGVEGNSRLTGLVAAVLFLLLGVEGATLLDVGQWLSIHAFIGMVLVPLVVVKLGSTGYRMARYYLRDERYRHRGPPHPVLRVLGPFVGLTTIALLASGIALITLGRRRYPWLGDLHRASFILWFALMVIHVLGHLVETARLASADLNPRRPRVKGASLRTSVVAVSLVIGIALGAATTGWVTTWNSNRRADHRRELVPR